MKRLSRILLTALAAVLTVSLAACGSGVKVAYVLPEGASGSAPASGSYEPYEQVVLPTAEATKDHAQQVGWQDAGGSYFANGSTLTVGTAVRVMSAVFQAKELIRSFCENPGTMDMTAMGKGLIGPTAAYTIFYADGTWTADAEGQASFSHFEGTWALSDGGELSMVLSEQDGVERNSDVEVTSDGKTFTYTLTHPGDRGGMKNHVNHISAYALITAYNAELGASVPVPEEPSFTVEFVSGKEDAAGDTAPVSGRLGETVTMPECGFTRDGADFTGWKADSVTYQPGDPFTVQGYDVTVTAQWSDDSQGGWGF